MLAQRHKNGLRDWKLRRQFSVRQLESYRPALQPTANRGRDLFIRHTTYRAFPDCRYTPASRPKCYNVASIACTVLFELLLPEFDIRGGCRCSGAAFMTVPEATLHEYDSLELRKHQVRPPRQAADMQPVTETSLMQSRPDASLRLCIVPSNTRHHAGSCCFIDDVCQISVPDFRFAIRANGLRKRDR